jgi:hypothetical protein
MDPYLDRRKPQASMCFLHTVMPSRDSGTLNDSAWEQNYIYKDKSLEQSKVILGKGHKQVETD